MFVNVSSHSIVDLYNKYIDQGLLALNIRGYIRNKRIDSGINKTLNKDREDFWFYNNGITIACSDFYRDGKKVKLYNFSIVNGGQTTTLIGKYSGSNSDEFYIPCKIVAYADGENPDEFFATIAEATNSQKPIKPRDLYSNSKEMKRLQSWLSDEGIFLEIKRGDQRRKKKGDELWKNEEFAQIIISFAFQQPGTARSGKSNIWSNKEIYNKIFMQNYGESPEKRAFILDLFELWKRVLDIEKTLKSGESPLKPEERDALKNGKMAIIALMGLLYDLVNNDIDYANLNENVDILTSHNFTYGPFIRNYHSDDVDDVLKRLVISLTKVIWSAYELAAKNGNCSSISNLLKTDKKYREEVVGFLLLNYSNPFGESILADAEKLFKRESATK